MTVLQMEQRAQVAIEAASWIDTPYVASQGCKGAGVDCAMILLRVYAACCLISQPEPQPYKGALARLRAGEQMYREVIGRFAREVIRAALPGDIVLFRVPMTTGRRVVARVTHGAIVEAWPWVIHAYQPAGRVVRTNLDQDRTLADITDSLWSLHCWEAAT